MVRLGQLFGCTSECLRAPISVKLMSTTSCPKCGASVPSGAAFCPLCGTNLSGYTPTQTQGAAPIQGQQSPVQASVPPPTPQQAAQQPQRPTGVVILAVLEVIGGVYTLISGAAAGAFFGLIAPPLAALGALYILIGVVDLLLAWGLYTGQNWARIVAIVFAILSLLAVPLGTIIGIIILYYLTRPNVKAFFGVK